MSEASRKGPVWQRIRLEILNRDGWLCAECGRHLEGADATVDHITPVSRGGGDEPSNLRALCRRCNGKRQDRALIRLAYVNERWLT